MIEKRKFPRVESSNLTYIYLDKKNQVIARGTGKTINISRSGFLVETTMELKKKNNLIAFIEVQDEMVELRGKIVHCLPLKEGKYMAGVEIKDMSNTGRPFWKRFIDHLLNTETIE